MAAAVAAIVVVESYKRLDTVLDPVGRRFISTRWLVEPSKPLNALRLTLTDTATSAPFARRGHEWQPHNRITSLNRIVPYCRSAVQLYQNSKSTKTPVQFWAGHFGRACVYDPDNEWSCLLCMITVNKRWPCNVHVRIATSFVHFLQVYTITISTPT